MKIFIKIYLISLLLVTTAYANEDQYHKPMEFYQGWDGGNALEALWIAAIGVIEEDTPEKFKQSIADGTKIVLHSPGGNLVAGIKLGRQIRTQRLNTFIANSINNPENRGPSGGNPHNDFAPGKCLSACAYAFLGGVDRIANIDKKNWGMFYHGMENSKIGFHKFYNDAEITKAISAKQANLLIKFSLTHAQFISGLIVSYMVDMGIDANFISLINGNESNDIIYFSDTVLKKYNVINDRGFGRWNMTPYKDGILTYTLNNASSYAYNLVEKVGIFCDTKSQSPIIVLDTFKSDSITDIEKSLPYNRNTHITIDGDEILIDGKNLKSIDMHSLYVAITNKKLVRKLYNAKELSVYVEVPRVEGGWYTPSISINGIEKKMIKLALHECLKY
ncbi:hypothetical protein QUF74_12240 [Candidatus Halobeggiatoa sp. HSG11]|nr:hypothetical protein [Candidatus Halobeggiatoa sp. HSG11]